MLSKSTLIKIALFAGLGTGLVCLIGGLLWDLVPFNKYQGMFWLTFCLSFVCDLLIGKFVISKLPLIPEGEGQLVD